MSSISTQTASPKLTDEEYIAELKEDKKQMEEYIAELKEDKKQMEDHYEAGKAWADEYANAGDEELIAEFKKRFVVPQFYTREQIVERIEGMGHKATDDNVDEVIADFQDNAYNDVDEILEGYIDNVNFDDENDYKDDIDPNLLKLCSNATIDFETYKEYFAQHYKQEKEHDEDTYFNMFVYAKKDPKPYEMSAWSDIYFKIEPDHEKTNKSFDKVKHTHYNTSSSFAMMLCGIEFEEEEDEEDHDICGQTGGKCGDFAGCGKKVLCEDTNMFGNTSFCIPCYEKYEEDFKKLEEEEDEEDEDEE